VADQETGGQGVYSLTFFSSRHETGSEELLFLNSRGATMNIALIGGIDRLERHYQKEALRAGVDLRIFNISEANINAKLKQVDATGGLSCVRAICPLPVVTVRPSAVPPTVQSMRKGA
jgi:hypothetical protein